MWSILICFHRFILILWPEFDRLIQVIFLIDFFPQHYHSILCWLRIWFCIFFYLFSMRLSRSYDPGCKFCEVACRLRFFGSFFNWFFLYISSFNIELIENSTLFFSLYWVILVLWFDFGKLTQVDSDFFNWLFSI